uniref:Putative DNA binding, helix-turn-helix domain containing protein n=1 Tax=viral metagenome TaxID=1070528 RepID=A0A6M3K985_9ZZZZ
MNLKEYLKKEKISQTEFAKKANISRQLLYWHLKNPGQPWSHKGAEKIVMAIYGEPIREKIVDLILGDHEK